MAADVDSLRRNPSPEMRATIARQFGRQLDQLQASGHAALAHAVLDLLVEDVAQSVREALAEAVAHSQSLPHETAMQLASDVIEVARPILQQSPVLEDKDLLQVIRTNAMQHALAIAGRHHLSRQVTDRLVDTGHQAVVTELAGNQGAELSEASLQRLQRDWSADSSIQAKLIQRPALPFEVVEQLVGVIGDRLEWDLVRTRQIDREAARALVRATRERAAITLVAREHADRTLQRDLRRRLGEGALTPDSILGFLRDGDVASFECALGLLAELEPRACRALVYGPDRRGMAALCIKAGLPTPHYLALRMALELAASAVSGGTGPQSYARETLIFLQDQYERLRQDPPLATRLCYMLGAGSS
jgi:uncharacterized protein (DUF2336 family)